MDAGQRQRPLASATLGHRDRLPQTQGHEQGRESTDHRESLVVRETVCGVDPAGGDAKESGSLLSGLRGDRVCERAEPEGAVEDSRGGGESVDKATREFERIAGGAELLLALAVELDEDLVTRRETTTPEGLRDVEALVFLREVADDPEQIPRVDTVGERVRDTLALEDRDAGDDVVEGIAGDRGPEVALRIVELEASEGVVEEPADDGILPGLERAPGELLLSGPLLERSPCLLDLLGRGVGSAIELLA